MITLLKVLVPALAFAMNFIGQGVASDKGHFCVVPILDGEPTEADANDGYRMVGRLVDFPTSPYPVIHPRNRDGVWTLSEERRFVPRTDGYNNSQYLNSLVMEVHSGRVLSLNRDREIIVLDPSSGWFQPLRVANAHTLGKARRLDYIPRWQATAITAETGLFRLSDDSLEPLPVRDGQLNGGIREIFDVPALEAIAIVTAERDLLLRLDDGQVLHLLSLKDLQETSEASKGWWDRILPSSYKSSWANRVGEWVMNVDVLAHTGDLVVTTRARIIYVPLSREGGKLAPAKPVVLDEREDASEFAIRWHVDVIQEYLAYRKLNISSGAEDRGLYYVRLGGLEPVPGGDIEVLGPNPQLFEVPSRNLAIIRGARELLSYSRDGTIAPIPGSSFDALGSKFVWVYDFVSIGKVVVRTPSALFEVTDAGRLDALSLPKALQGAKLVSLAEMPNSNAAIVFTDRGLFALSQNGLPERVSGTHRANVYHAPSLLNASYLAARRELLFAARNGIFLVLDRRIAGTKACGE